MKSKSQFFIASLILVILPSFCLSQTYKEGIKILAEELAPQIVRTGKKKVAVYNFENTTRDVTEFGLFIADKLSVALAKKSSGIEVIDRQRIEVLIEENNLSRKGFIDPQTAKQLGKIAGIELLVVGTINSIGETFDISAKILDLETAIMRGGTETEISITNDLNEMHSKIVFSSEKQSQPQTQNSSPSKGTQSKPDENTGGEFGTICFRWNSRDTKIETLQIGIWYPDTKVIKYYNSDKVITVTSQDEKCMYELKPGVYTYWAGASYSRPSYRGEILAEKGKMKVVEIK